MSYSHSDKQVVRRIARRMDAHGIAVWLDERELRLGTALDPAIRREIENSDILLTVVSRTSVDSKWVEREIDHAADASKAIFAVFIDPELKNSRLEEYLWADASDPQRFADVIHHLMRDVHALSTQALPPPDRAKMEAGLRELVRTEPVVAPLVLGFLDGMGLHEENIAVVFGSPFHIIDETLNSLFDIQPGEAAAFHAAEGFRRAGAGTRALSLWIEATGDGGSPLVSAIGHGPLEPALIPAMIRLLAACATPNNDALGKFIGHNADQLDDMQRNEVIRLATWPLRNPADHCATVMGWQALEHLPGTPEILGMWRRWIREGAFDSDPQHLARYLVMAREDDIEGTDVLIEALQEHVRSLLRSSREDNVHAATNHLISAAEAGSPALTSLLYETTAAPGTAEWDRWRQHEPDTADWMACYLRELASEAVGGQDWLHALDESRRKTDLARKLRDFRKST